MGYLFFLLSLIFVAIGIFGCVIKGLPGPVFSFLALLFLDFSQGGTLFPMWSLVVAGIIVLIIWIPDFFIPWWHEKMFEISHTTTWGALLGMFVGFFIIPPVGVGIGIISGSIIGELIAKKEMRIKLDAEGFNIAEVMTAMITKLTVAAIISYYYFFNLFALNLSDLFQKYQNNIFPNWL